MITPIELHNKQLKSGRGYNKKEMDIFLDEVFHDYEILYKENAELKEKISQLSDGIQYYKAMETTLQKALVLAEKTSKDTIESANSKAALIEKEACINADKIINNARLKSDEIKNECISLLQQYKQFKAQFKQIAQKQIELLDGNFYEIYSKDLIDAINDVSYQVSENNTETVTPEKTETNDKEIYDNEINESAIEEIKSETDIVTAPEMPVETTEKIPEKITKRVVDGNKADISVPKGDTKEFAPIEIEIISKNIDNKSENNKTENIVYDKNEMKSSPVNQDTIQNTDDSDNIDNDPFNKIIRELKEDLANELANSNSASSFEFIDND